MEAKECLKYFVGGIPSDVKHKDLYDFFKKYGVVKRITIFNSNKGKKLFGFCFVKFKSIFGQGLLDRTSVFKFQGRNLEIDPIIRRSNLKQSIQEKHSKRVFLQNIPKNIDDSAIREIFSPYGPIINCFVISRGSPSYVIGSASYQNQYAEKDDSQPSHNPKSNYGYIIFKNAADAETLVQKKFVELSNKGRIYVKRYCSSIKRSNEEDKPVPNSEDVSQDHHNSGQQLRPSEKGLVDGFVEHFCRPTQKGYYVTVRKHETQETNFRYNIQQSEYSSIIQTPANCS